MSKITVDTSHLRGLVDRELAFQVIALIRRSEGIGVKLKLSKDARYTEGFFIEIFKYLVGQGVALTHLKIVSDVAQDIAVYSLIQQSVKHVEILSSAGA